MIIICCGMYRSGSTWQYLVASELVELSGRGHRIGFLTGDDFVTSPYARTASDEFLVLKCHDYHAAFEGLIVSGKAKAVYSYRDVRDVACSLMWKLQLSLDQVLTNRVLHSAIESFDRWMAVPDRLAQTYETIINDPERAVGEIADYLGVEVDQPWIEHIVTKYSLDANRERAQHFAETLRRQGVDLSQPASALFYDQSTLLHWNHIRPTGYSDWHFVFDFRDLLKLQPVVSPWLISNGIEKDDSWVFQPVLQCVAVEDRPRVIQALLAYREALLSETDQVVEQQRQLIFKLQNQIASLIGQPSLDIQLEGKIVGAGWYPCEKHPQHGYFRWTGPKTRSTLDLRLATDQDLVIRLRVIAAYAADILDSLALSANDVPVPLQRGPDPESGGTIFEGTIPRTALVARPGFARLTFQVNRTVPPSVLEPDNPDPRRLGVAINLIHIAPARAASTVPLENLPTEDAECPLSA